MMVSHYFFFLPSRTTPPRETAASAIDGKGRWWLCAGFGVVLAGIASGVAAGIVRIVARVADNDLGILRRLVVLLGYPVVVVWQRLPIIVVIAPAYRASAAGAAAVVVAAIVAVVTAAGVIRAFIAAGVGARVCTLSDKS